MDNPEKLGIPGTQDTAWTKTNKIHKNKLTTQKTKNVSKRNWHIENQFA